MSTQKDEKVFQLIALVQNFSVLYDTGHKEYKLRKKKDEIWEYIASEINATGGAVTSEWCRKKWKYVRDEFSKKCSDAKIQFSGQTPIEEIGIDLKSWPFFKSLMFLIRCRNPRTTVGNFDTEDEDVECVEVEAKGDKEDQECDEEGVEESIFLRASKQPGLPAPTVKELMSKVVLVTPRNTGPSQTAGMSLNPSSYFVPSVVTPGLRNLTIISTTREQSKKVMAKGLEQNQLPGPSQGAVEPSGDLTIPTRVAPDGPKVKVTVPAAERIGKAPLKPFHGLLGTVKAKGKAGEMKKENAGQDATKIVDAPRNLTAPARVAPDINKVSDAVGQRMGKTPLTPIETSKRETENQNCANSGKRKVRDSNSEEPCDESVIDKCYETLKEITNKSKNKRRPDNLGFCETLAYDLDRLPLVRQACVKLKVQEIMLEEFQRME